MKRFVTLLLVLVLGLASFTACGEIKYEEANYKALDSTKAEKIVTKAENNTSEEAINEATKNGMHGKVISKTTRGETVIDISTEYYMVVKGKDTFLSLNMTVPNILTGGTISTEAYVDKDYIYTNVGGVKTKVTISQLGLDKWLEELDTESFTGDIEDYIKLLGDLEALKEMGISVSIAKQGLTTNLLRFDYDMSALAEEFSSQLDTSLTTDNIKAGSEMYAVIAFDNNGFCGFRVYANLEIQLGEETIKTEMEMQLEPFDGKITYPEDLDGYTGV